MYEIGSSTTLRINGGYLQNSLGKAVLIMGSVTRTLANRSIELTTTDNRKVTVKMPATFESFDEPPDLVEIYGTARGSSMIECISYTVFPAEMRETFDANDYNEVMDMINKIPEYWKLSNH